MLVKWNLTLNLTSDDLEICLTAIRKIQENLGDEIDPNWQCV